MMQKCGGRKHKTVKMKMTCQVVTFVFILLSLHTFTQNNRHQQPYTLHNKVVFRLRGAVWLSKFITKLMITKQLHGETIPCQKTFNLIML